MVLISKDSGTIWYLNYLLLNVIWIYIFLIVFGHYYNRLAFVIFLVLLDLIELEMFVIPDKSRRLASLSYPNF